MFEDVLFHVTRGDGSSLWNGPDRWPLPSDGKPGAWRTVGNKPLEAGYYGFHLCRMNALYHWIGPAVFVVETRGEVILPDTDEPVARCARLVSRIKGWDETSLEKFATECFERVRPLFESSDPPTNQFAKTLLHQWQNGSFHHVPRSVTEVVADREKEVEWQTQRLFGYLEPH